MIRQNIIYFRICGVMAIAACFLILPPAYAIEFAFPVQCAYGTDCFIQNYIDHDASENYADHTCGHLTYNAHDGIDIRLRDYVAMEKGVKVIAAAPGVVTAVREGMQDINVNKIGKDNVYRRGCGNAVVIQHEEGYQTSYCHMMQGSVRVTRGQQVTTGTVLGEVGLSGLTEFPHLHFGVKKGGKTLDPFIGGNEVGVCNSSTVTPLWDVKTRQLLRYIPTAILNAEFSDKVPAAEEARHGGYALTQIPRSFQQLVFWIDIMGPQAGDELLLRITSPLGTILVERTIILDRNKALYYQLIGKKRRPNARWSAGPYKGEAILRRKGIVVAKVERRATLR